MDDPPGCDAASQQTKRSRLAVRAGMAIARDGSLQRQVGRAWPASLSHVLEAMAAIHGST
jgi:hypothetical protein